MLSRSDNLTIEFGAVKTELLAYARGYAGDHHHLRFKSHHVTRILTVPPPSLIELDSVATSFNRAYTFKFEIEHTQPIFLDRKLVSVHIVLLVIVKAFDEMPVIHQSFEPSLEQVEKFANLVSDSIKNPLFFHSKERVWRTYAMVSR
ncbi:hypothetical protein Ddye_005538 [Dipteronia dyeriana]|uniref:DSP-PTPase phosphatase fused to NAD+ Kinase domain-containing protein n=1 Tax=Dipteronia dyeriana TaxID=168575 RepID=A0AAE0CPQ9_9ROSI|nr:hypothetical protein Ddye_005538 [Dipteronia dyeriana]